MSYTKDDVAGLADKLDALALNDGERAALDAVLTAAADDEVSGFVAGSVIPGGNYRPETSFRPKLGKALGIVIIGDPNG